MDHRIHDDGLSVQSLHNTGYKCQHDFKAYVYINLLNKQPTSRVRRLSDINRLPSTHEDRT